MPAQSMAVCGVTVLVSMIRAGTRSPASKSRVTASDISGCGNDRMTTSDTATRLSRDACISIFGATAAARRSASRSKPAIRHALKRPLLSHCRHCQARLCRYVFLSLMSSSFLRFCGIDCGLVAVLGGFYELSVTRPAVSTTAWNRTLALAVAHAGLISSASLCDSPSTQGHITIAVGAT